VSVFWKTQPLRARTEVTQLQTSALPGDLLEAVARQDGPAVLESTALHETHGRYTVMACRPLEVLTLRQGVLAGSRGEILAADSDEAIWQALDEAFGAVDVPNEPGNDEAGYLPGWIGYVGYEVGRHVERLPGRAVRDTHLPDLRLGFYDALLVYDAILKRWRLVRLLFENPPPGAGQAAETLLAIAAGDHAAADPQPPSPAEQADALARPAASAACNFTPDEYRRAVARCVEYIAAGDIFQVNLSQRFALADAPPPLAIYRSLRRRNPAWFSAYLSFRSAGAPCAILSSSPELFVSVRDGCVVTRPIKGTRPRIGDEKADALAAAELWHSEKDNAELAMIIDLLRNDIGRVCNFGSVQVSQPRCLETHPTVFHLVGTVQGRLREGIGPGRLLRATLPGGSITGAPKIRAMEIIDELEGVARGVYTGCIGHVGVDGSSTWNIAIRTIVHDAGTAYVQVGGGIVADSTPDGEYRETLDKARALLEAIAMAQAPLPVSR